MLQHVTPETKEWFNTAGAVSEALDELGAAAVGALIEAMRHEKWYIREFSAFALGRTGHPAAEAVPVLIEAMRDENFLVTEAAEDGLGALGMSSAKARKLMIDALSSDDPFVRKSVAAQLGHILAQGKDALPALERLTKDPDGEVREAAAEAIRMITEAL